jgi:hypothetical protein
MEFVVLNVGILTPNHPGKDKLSYRKFGVGRLGPIDIHFIHSIEAAR